ncbi:hypothetical protein SODALDRAFT_327248 [Sodiomyces alkalinus F11]|uniref:GDP/GTP exchange factor Sec2 N-terminal domain-containing protein n=1 Tax=Sodiomyces alkalinus (strain CBS 110278 / VKM F-3762 / F11) TaxID=1314773 RepID=A0A3N2Q8H8_SODAK|nr:hypothetical protein SODALDRAFT_327248 [Sodiomyces alkalinus F11]ROT43081.1 hypothetical protein SODALDRAFT_327248 [Sodiomyces alkalinus F11]
MATVAAPSPPPTSLSLTTDPPNPAASSSRCCPGCGLALPPPNPAFQTDGERGGARDEGAAASLTEAQARIADLEAQVRLLNQKATAAIDRWADYEDELARLRQELESRGGRGEAGGGQDTPPPPPPKGQDPSSSPTRSSYLPSSAGGVANRLSALLSRKSTPNLRPDSNNNSNNNNNNNNTNNNNPSSPASDAAAPHHLSPESSSASASAAAAVAASHPLNAHADLLSALRREQSLRVAAENRLTASSHEVEELSASLFEQANEMVATERRARAKLEERVELLERRDAEKRLRLEKLEGAVGRIERVRALLGEGRLGRARAGGDGDGDGAGGEEKEEGKEKQQRDDKEEEGRDAVTV